MGGEILSQDEVESLLSMMDSETSKPKPDESRWEVDDTTIERVGKDELKMLQNMHDQFARRIAAKISTMLQSVVDVRLISIDQLCYIEFIFGLDNPTCFNLLQVKTPHGDENMFLDINPSVLLIMIEHMLGGGGVHTLPARRPLTNIEVRLAQRIIDDILVELKNIWQKTADLDFTVAQTESNPQMIQVVEPNDVVIVLCFEVALVEIRGTMTLCIPVEGLFRISSAFDIHSKIDKQQEDFMSDNWQPADASDPSFQDAMLNSGFGLVGVTTDEDGNLYPDAAVRRHQPTTNNIRAVKVGNDRIAGILLK